VEETGFAVADWNGYGLTSLAAVDVGMEVPVATVTATVAEAEVEEGWMFPRVIRQKHY
jgi:hypothetical protein